MHLCVAINNTIPRIVRHARCPHMVRTPCKCVRPSLLSDPGMLLNDTETQAFKFGSSCIDKHGKGAPIQLGGVPVKRQLAHAKTVNFSRQPNSTCGIRRLLGARVESVFGRIARWPTTMNHAAVDIRHKNTRSAKHANYVLERTNRELPLREIMANILDDRPGVICIEHRVG